jgi:6-phosphogluconolactonase/glucosamine-6-phosphate isomerase/deaminase
MFVFRNSKQPIEEAGALLSSYLGELKGLPTLFLTSGGSSLLLLDYIPEDVLGPNMTISVLDERFSTDENINNFAQMTKHPFYSLAVNKNCSFIDTRVKDGDTKEKLADRFEEELRNWRNQNQQGKIIITQGIAEDGHTSGIMPMLENPDEFKKLFESDNWIQSYHVSADKNPHTERVTTTLSFLRDEVDIAIGFAVDEKKRSILGRVCDGKNELYILPARIMHQMKDVIIVSNVL